MQFKIEARLNMPYWEKELEIEVGAKNAAKSVAEAMMKMPVQRGKTDARMIAIPRRKRPRSWRVLKTVKRESENTWKLMKRKTYMA